MGCGHHNEPYGIHVNSINPIVTLAPMAITAWSELAKRDPALKGIALGRFDEQDEVAVPNLFSLSDAAAMISGIVMPIDGGFTARGIFVRTGGRFWRARGQGVQTPLPSARHNRMRFKRGPLHETHIELLKRFELRFVADVIKNERNLQPVRIPHQRLHHRIP